MRSHSPQELSIEKFPVESRQTGKLQPYAPTRTGKDGVKRSYPIIEGDRDKSNDQHWYWLFCWKELEQGKWRSRSKPVKIGQVAQVREAIAAGKNYSTILKEIFNGEKTKSLDDRSNQ